MPAFPILNPLVSQSLNLNSPDACARSAIKSAGILQTDGNAQQVIGRWESPDPRLIFDARLGFQHRPGWWRG